MGYYTRYMINSPSIEEWTDEVKKSFRHPTLLFELYGKGEDGEQWKKYFKNGKSFTTYATVTFEEFNETKLK